jgi:hypothetical protein
MPQQQTLEPAERAAALRRRAGADNDHAADAERAPHPLITLGRQVGNAQVARMLAQREGEEEEVQAKHDLAQRAGEEEEEVQAKHDLAQRAGEEEEEVQASHDLAQREGEEEEEIAAKHDLSQRVAGATPQPEVGLEGGAISAELSGQINAKRGGGSALDTGTRATMEQSFGTSFEDVRVHTDSESDALNRSISAKAFTTGNDVFFRKDTSPGDHGLLAHELTHVVQQRSGGGGGGGMTVGPAGDSHEQQADAVSTAVTSGAAAQAQRDADQALAQRVLAQRQGEETQEDEGAM